MRYTSGAWKLEDMVHLMGEVVEHADTDAWRKSEYLQSTYHTKRLDIKLVFVALVTPRYVEDLPRLA